MKRVLSITLGLMVVGQGAVFAAAPAPVANKGAAGVVVTELTNTASSSSPVAQVAPADFNDLTRHCQNFVKSVKSSDLDQARTELKYVQAILGSADNVEVVPATISRSFKAPVRGISVAPIVVTGRKSLLNFNAADIEAALTELGFVEYGINIKSKVAVKAEFLKTVLDNLESLLENKDTQAAQVQELYNVFGESSTCLAVVSDEDVKNWLKLVSSRFLAKISQVSPAGSSWARYASGAAILTVFTVALMTKKK